MPRRSQIFTKLPWNGGLNSAVDEGVVNDNDLVQADDIVFATSGARIKREGYDFFDAPSAIPAVITRSSAGTTRTLVFESGVSSGSTEKLVLGENITITSTGGETDYEGSVSVVTISTTTVTNDTITYVNAPALAEGATATSTLTVIRNHKIIGLKDFFYLPTGAIDKAQFLVAVSDQGKIYKYTNSGNRTELALAGGATALGSITRVNFEVIQNLLVIAFDGVISTPKKFEPNTSLIEFDDLGGSPPNFSVCRQHLGRLFTNDKDRPDRLHYSPPGNAEKWQGAGDSGGRDVFPGDGDPDGIVTIMPPFKNTLYISKKSRIFQVDGLTPEDFTFIPVSNGLGATSNQAAVAVDLDDLMFISDKGFHSLVATAAHGDFEASFLSLKIQNDFNENFDPAQLRNTQGVYIPEINSVLFSIFQDGATSRNRVLLFNVNNKEWYEWPNVSVDALSSRRFSDRELRSVFGTNEGRIIQAQNGTRTDFGTSGPSYVVKSGAIYPDANPQSLKMFKKLSLYFRPRGDFSFTVRVKIDNQAEQVLSFDQGGEFDLLGSTFILGSSILGNAGVLAPFTRSIDGIGRGLTMTIESSGTNEPVEIYGYSIEFENADINQEVL